MTREERLTSAKKAVSGAFLSEAKAEDLRILGYRWRAESNAMHRLEVRSAGQNFESAFSDGELLSFLEMDGVDLQIDNKISLLLESIKSSDSSTAKEHFTPGEVVFREGSRANDMYQILSGKVRVSKTIEGRDIELASLGKNDFFGEMSLLLRIPRTATIVAIEATETLVIDEQRLLRKIETNPQFAFIMITTLARRLKQSHAIITDLQGIRKSLEALYGTNGRV